MALTQNDLFLAFCIIVGDTNFVDNNVIRRMKVWEYTKDAYYGNWRVWKSLTTDTINVFHVQSRDEASKLVRLLNGWEFGPLPKHLIGDEK